MKTIYMIILPLAVFLALSIWSLSNINRTSEELAAHLDRISEAVEDENWPLAIAAFEQVDKKWIPVRKRWKIFIDHIDVDRIDSSLVRIGKCIDIEQKRDCLVEIAVLRELILHVPEKERIKLSNIF